MRTQQQMALHVQYVNRAPAAHSRYYVEPSVIVTPQHPQDSSLIDIAAVFKLPSSALQFPGLPRHLSGGSSSSQGGSLHKGASSSSSSRTGPNQLTSCGLAVHVCDAQTLLRALPLCEQLPSGASPTSAAVVLTSNTLVDGDISVWARFAIPAAWSNPILYLGPQQSPHAARHKTAALNQVQAAPRTAAYDCTTLQASTAGLPATTNSSYSATVPAAAGAGINGTPLTPAPAAVALLTPDESTMDATPRVRPAMLVPHPPASPEPPTYSPGGRSPGAALRRSRLSVCTTASDATADSPLPTPLTMNSEPSTPVRVPRPALIRSSSGCLTPHPPAGLPPKARLRQRMAALPTPAALGLPAELADE